MRGSRGDSIVDSIKSVLPPIRRKSRFKGKVDEPGWICMTRSELENRAVIRHSSQLSVVLRHCTEKTSA